MASHNASVLPRLSSAPFMNQRKIPFENDLPGNRMSGMTGVPKSRNHRKPCLLRLPDKAFRIGTE